jgi:hypothetical protein
MATIATYFPNAWPKMDTTATIAHASRVSKAMAPYATTTTNAQVESPIARRTPNASTRSVTMTANAMRPMWAMAELVNCNPIRPATVSVRDATSTPNVLQFRMCFMGPVTFANADLVSVETVMIAEKVRVI